MNGYHRISEPERVRSTFLQVDEQVRMSTVRRRLLKYPREEVLVTGTQQLVVQLLQLTHVATGSEQTYVVGVQRYVSLGFVLRKQILDQVYDVATVMMGSPREPSGDDRTVQFLKVVEHDRRMTNGHKVVGRCTFHEHHRNFAVCTQSVVSRLVVLVKNVDPLRFVFENVFVIQQQIHHQFGLSRTARTAYQKTTRVFYDTIERLSHGCVGSDLSAGVLYKRPCFHVF